MRKLAVTLAGMSLWVCMLLGSGCATSVTPSREAPTVTPGGAAPTEQDKWEKWDKEGPRRLRDVLGGHFKSRCLDFMDMFEAGLSFGPWARVEAQYGIGFWGFGATDLQRWRLGQRSVVANEESATISTLPFPASLILFPAFFSDNEVVSTIVPLGGVCEEDETPIWPAAIFTGSPPVSRHMRIMCIERDVATHSFKVTGDSFMVGLDAHLLIGARARIRPVQIPDFIVGIFGWDLLGDDVKPYYPQDELK